MALPVLVDLDLELEEGAIGELLADLDADLLEDRALFPITIPFWLSRSTRISTRMRGHSHSVTRVAIECGISSRRWASSCSRTSSATQKASGASVTMPSG